MPSPYIPLLASAYRLALADMNCDGSNEVVYGAYDGTVRCICPRSGEQLWQRDVGGFPFAVSTAMLAGEDTPVVLAASADNRVYALDADGSVRWTYDTGRPVYNVTCAKLTNDSRFIVCGGMDHVVTVLDLSGNPVATHAVEVVTTRLAAADFDGDGCDEILAVDNREQALLLKFVDGRLQQLWHRRLTVPDAMRNWENPRGSFFVFALDTTDINADGKAEAVVGDAYFNCQAVMAIDGAGDPLWLTDPLPRHMDDTRQYEFYSTAFVRVATNVPGHATPVVLVVAGGLVRMLQPNGTLIGEAEAPVGFSDLVVDGATLYLGSSPNGDRTLYRVDLAGDWEAQVAGLERHGLVADIGCSIDGLRRRVADMPTTTNPPAEPYHVKMFGVRPYKRRSPADDDSADGNAIEQRIAQSYQHTRAALDAFEQRFGKSVFMPVASTKVIAAHPPLNADGEPWNPLRWRTDSINGTMSDDEILRTAELVEQFNIPTIFGIGHSCMPFISLDLAERILKAAPHALVGFMTSEDERFEDVPRYAAEFMAPLADLCLAHGGKLCMTKNKNVWWLSMPSLPTVFDALFSGRRPEVFVAPTEDSNSRTPEINLMARFGLRQAGLIKGFEISTHGDIFSYCRFHQWEYPKHGHPFLRLLVAQTVLGGDSFRLGGWLTTRRGVDLAFNRMGRESAETFLHLVRTGLVFAPRPDQVVHMSPLGIAMHSPPEEWLVDGHNGHRPHIAPCSARMEHAVIPHGSCTWGNTPTPAHALQYVLFRKRRQFGCFVPPTPFGAVALVPVHANLSNVVGVTDWWHTDGVDLWREGQRKLTGTAAAHALEASYRNAERELPFHVEGDDVFFQALRMSDNHYRLYAIDPGWLDPRSRTVTVTPRLEGTVTYQDAISGEQLTAEDGRTTLDVPAGMFRIIDAELH